MFFFVILLIFFFFFFFNDTATTEIYTLSLHDALPISGGIDSAVVAALAADALGGDNVHGVSMPSQYSSSHSKDDAADLAQRIGAHYRVEPVEDMVRVYVDQLRLTGLAEENIQA